MSRDIYAPAEDTTLLLGALPEPFGARLALEVGPGSGVVAYTLQAMGWRVLAVDVNPHAAAATAAVGVPTLRGDLATALRGPFDLVAFNAPYLPSSDEEHVAGWLDHAFHGGEGGIEVSARLVRDLPRILAPGGHALLVVSSRADLATLEGVLAQAGLGHEKTASARFFFEEIAVWKLARAAP